MRLIRGTNSQQKKAIKDSIDHGRHRRYVEPRDHCKYEVLDSPAGAARPTQGTTLAWDYLAESGGRVSHCARIGDQKGGNF